MVDISRRRRTHKLVCDPHCSATSTPHPSNETTTSICIASALGNSLAFHCLPADDAWYVSAPVGARHRSFHAAVRWRHLPLVRVLAVWFCLVCGVATSPLVMATLSSSREFPGSSICPMSTLSRSYSAGAWGGIHGGEWATVQAGKRVARELHFIKSNEVLQTAQQ